MANVELRAVSKRYGDLWAVKRAGFVAPAGSFTSLLGPSGCGKTTSLRLIAGFVAPDEGEIRIAGQAVGALPPWRRNLGVVFQNYALFPFMTVFDNVAFGLHRRKIKGADAAKRVAEALDLVGLPGLDQRYPRQLSGGQQQRVALARALVIRPEVLLLDEPLSNLDAKLRAEMRFELKRIQRETGVTSIFVTHDQEEALTLSDQIIVMNEGAIEGIGTPKEVWEKPKTAFVADFLGVENLIPAKPAGGAGADGQTFDVDGYDRPIHVSGPAEDHGDAPVVLGIRSGDVEMDRSESTVGINEVAGTVREFTYLGAAFAYQIQTPLRSEPMIVVSKEEIGTGEAVRLRLPVDSLMVLQPERG